jgi:hypothetical protein
MAENPFSERVIQLGEERLDSYTKRILDFLDTIEAETPETFIPFLAYAAQPNPELLYYANAYADHYRVKRALVYAVIEQESNWNPSALSNQGATGLMQLMPETARVYGVRNRYVASQNLSGGVQYLGIYSGGFMESCVWSLRPTIADPVLSTGAASRTETLMLWSMSRPSGGGMNVICGKNSFAVLLLQQEASDERCCVCFDHGALSLGDGELRPAIQSGIAERRRSEAADQCSSLVG